MIKLVVKINPRLTHQCFLFLDFVNDIALSFMGDTAIGKNDPDVSASQLFASQLCDAVVPADQISAMVVVQQRMLSRFERTNALLSTAIEVVV